MDSFDVEAPYVGLIQKVTVGHDSKGYGKLFPYKGMKMCSGRESNPGPGISCGSTNHHTMEMLPAAAA